ncbi:MAG: hypothetical protein DRP78_02440 [Candidatus Omnitrophota bacterium]|nr:MAG: hypothetical protein DRP78_02440 [Candidatus Omnitrophota bacterium]
MFKKLIFILLICVLCCFQSSVQAKGNKFKRTDRNRDGVIDRKEWRKEKIREEKHQFKSNNWWRKRADTNNDGAVSADELSAWKQLSKQRIDLNGDGEISPKEKRLCWRHARSKVNTRLEAKYDTNADGWLSPSEVKEFFKDRYSLIKSNGHAKVDSVIEEEYDFDHNGVIDSEEAKILKEDIE